MPAAHAPTLLFVEDDPGHARLIARHLQRAHLPFALVHLGDGQTALDYLRQAREAQHPFPCVVLLDLNLPGRSGMDVLGHLKGDPHTRHIPVIMLTTTDEPHEIEQSYALGCNAYLTKPLASEQFGEVIRQLGLFLSYMQVPRGTCTAWPCIGRSRSSGFVNLLTLLPEP